MSRLAEALATVAPPDEPAMAAARMHLDRLTKPPGSLGRLEELVVWLAGVTGQPSPPLENRVVVVAAADHGVASAQGVSAYPSAVTAQMVGNFLAGGAAISVLARAAGADVVIVDAGVGTPMGVRPWPAVGDGSAEARLVAWDGPRGTADMTLGPAMTRQEAETAVDHGLATATELIEAGADVIAVGEMGIGNTTAASAIVAALTGLPPSAVTGRGTGIDDAGWQRKVAVVQRALVANRPSTDDPIGVLAAVGGLEIAALVGLIAASTARRVPVVLDGFITAAAALVACRLKPPVAPRLLAAHRSTEPGHAIILDELGLRPLLDLHLRLGEGTGAALALLLLDAAVRIRDGMATFESAGVSNRAPN